MKPTLLIMAAGMGSRYGGLKQIDPIGPNGEIVLDYSIHDAIHAGFGRIVFVIRKDIEAEFRQAVGAKYESLIDVDYAFQDLKDIPAGFEMPADRQKPWGTAHAILAARHCIKDPFAALNADDFYGAHSFTVLSDYLQTASDQDGVLDWSMVGFILKNTLSQFGSVGRGVCSSDAAMNLQGVVEHTSIEERDGAVTNTSESGEKTQLTGKELVSMNMWGFTPSYFDVAGQQFEEFLTQRGQELKSEFYIPSVVDRLIKEGSVTCKILPTESTWFGVTYQEDKPYVMDCLKALADQGAYSSPLWS